MIKIALFASGSGTNAENIVNYFKNNANIKISLIASNNSEAYVLQRAKKLSVPTLVFNRNDFYKSDKILDYLKQKDIDFIVLAGFLWLIPSNLTKNYVNKIINIHPALLPAYGGKGMYGGKVHESVILNNEKQSGITIHYVNERYDEGKIIFQEKCNVLPNDTSKTLAAKIHELEYKYFPKTIEQVIANIYCL